ncbi:MAG: hypothetical protein LQ348_007461, partial [Seirophora lacunosa]
TPSKPIDKFAKLTTSPTEKSNVASRIMRSSLHEPSPASTYGETNAGDSIPATPQDFNDHGMSSPDPHAMSDEQLERSVAAAFARFGRCFVKIRRDNKGMPFAFVQYEHANDAQRAITMGRGLIIEGRACRTEVAKVNPTAGSLYLSKIAGGEITEADARQALAPYGALEKLWYCSQTDKEMFRLPEGVWVMFAFFQDCRDAQAGFRENPTYRLEQPKMPEDLRGRLGNRSNTVAYSPTTRYSHSHWEASPQEMMQRATDPVSIFIGNLSPNVTEDMLRELFGRYGRIMDVDIHRRSSANAGPNAFAFIQYYTVDEAKHALNYRYVLGGSTLRVEPKESAASLARRESIVSRGSPPTRFQANKETMELLFQHGVSVGIANANASQSPNTASTLYTPYHAYALPGIHGIAPIDAPNHLMENEGSPGLHAHSHHPFASQSLNHIIPQGFGQYHVPTIAPAQTTNYIPRTNLAQRTTDYQWPPVDPTLPKMAKEHSPREH